MGNVEKAIDFLYGIKNQSILVKIVGKQIVGRMIMKECSVSNIFHSFYVTSVSGSLEIQEKSLAFCNVENGVLSYLIDGGIKISVEKL